MISVLYIVMNEERYIERSINSIKEAPGVEEIVVVDGGSIDSTALIASRFGAKIFYFEWQHDFSVSRNFGIGKCSQPWIFSLDADEHVEGENLKLFQKAVDQADINGIVAYQLPRKNHYPLHESGSPYFGPPFYPDLQTRLFKNMEGIRYSGAIHEGVVQTIEVSGIGGIGRLPVCIHHHLFRGDKEANERDKRLYYESIEESKNGCAEKMHHLSEQPSDI